MHYTSLTQMLIIETKNTALSYKYSSDEIKVMAVFFEKFLDHISTDNENDYRLIKLNLKKFIVDELSLTEVLGNALYVEQYIRLVNSIWNSPELLEHKTKNIAAQLKLCLNTKLRDVKESNPLQHDDFWYKQAYKCRNIKAHLLPKYPVWEQGLFLSGILCVFLKATWLHKEALNHWMILRQFDYKGYLERMQSRFKKDPGYIPIKGTLIQTTGDRIIDVGEYVKQENEIKLLGQAGIGKTTFFKHIISEEIDKLGEENNPLFVPVYIRLIEFQNREQKVEQYVCNQLAIDSVLLDNLIKEKFLHFYFDGINEIAPKEDSRAILQDIDAFIHKCQEYGNRVLISDRENNNLQILNSATTIHINKFDDEQIFDFIKLNAKNKTTVQNALKYYEDDAYSFLQELLGIPFFLKTFISLVDKEVPVPADKIEYIKAFTEEFINREIREKYDPNAQHIVQMLTIISEMGPDGISIAAVRQLMKDKADGGLNTEALLKLAVELHFLELTNNKYRFVCEEFQIFFLGKLCSGDY